MTSEELETLRRDIDSLRKAVRKADPFLRSIVALRAYARLSLPFGVIVLAFCLGSHYLIQAYGGFDAIPSAWKTGFWILLAVLGAASWGFKWVAVSRRAAEVEPGANFWTVTKALFGSAWSNLNLSIAACILAVGAFAIVKGHPWYIVNVLAVFLGLICNSIGIAVDRREYLITGWYALATGLAALFFIETAPFVCTGIVWAGIFFVYAAAGLHYMPREGKEG
jgi:hypothetical protein